MSPRSRPGRMLNAGRLSVVVALIAGLVTAASTQISDGPDELIARCAAMGATSTEEIPIIGLPADARSDAAPAIQAAIRAAMRNGGGVVRLPKGEFTIGAPLRLGPGVKLAGSGAETIVRRGATFLDTEGPYRGHPMITTDNAPNVTIADLVVDQRAQEVDVEIERRLHESMIDVRRSSNALVDRVITRNPFAYSIGVAGSTAFCVMRSETSAASRQLYDQLDGIHVLDSSVGIVAANRVDQRMGSDGDDGLAAHTIGAPVHDVIFADNEVRGGVHGNGMQFAAGDFPIFDILVTRNRFWGAPKGVRTGYYSGPTHVQGVVISDNVFVDATQFTVDFTGDVTDVHVTSNLLCNSATPRVVIGAGNTVAGNADGCTQGG
jgi:hypothetical protein